MRNWRENLDDATIATFQNELDAMGCKFQFVTLAGFHALNQRCGRFGRWPGRERNFDLRAIPARRGLWLSKYW